MTTNCIFEKSWWLDAVAPNSWNAIEIEKNDEIVARLPYVVKKRMGLTLLTMPRLTQTLGPWLQDSTAKYSKQLSHQKDLYGALIEKLPHYDYFCMKFHYSMTNWLPFYWHGFNQTTYYSYVLENIDDLDMVWNGFQENIRREIRKAQKQVVVRKDLDVNKFLDINLLTFQRQGKNLPYSPDLIQHLDAACDRNQARQMFFAEDAQGRIHAAIYIIWDEKSAYYLMGGGDPELRTSGATSLLMWEAIKFASTVTNKFDFEGSIIEPIERFVRAFGGRQIPYFQVSKTSRQMQLLLSSREIVRAIIRNQHFWQGVE
jgi:lipid II:glycine glycyltransferase (peptidoglycan interpeptide bridge formation enzyme)